MDDNVQVQTFEGAEEEAIVLYNTEDNLLPSLYTKIDRELENRIKSVPAHLKNQIKDQVFDTLLWQYIKEIPIPLEVIKSRVGSKGQEYEYFDEHYTNSELDRLFPGWWTEECVTRYDPQTQAYITSGYLCVEYILPSGQKKIRKVYAVGGAQVFAKVADREAGQMTPSQPEDRAIASVTRWQKLAGKKLGIGIEIYHQQITPRLSKQFQEIVELWKYPYAEPHKEAFNKMTKGKGVRDLLKAMPTLRQTEAFLKALQLLPADDPIFEFDKAWEYFTKQNRVSADKAIEIVAKGVYARLKKIEAEKVESTYQ